MGVLEGGPIKFQLLREMKLIAEPKLMIFRWMGAGDPLSDRRIGDDSFELHQAKLSWPVWICDCTRYHSHVYKEKVLVSVLRFLLLENLRMGRHACSSMLGTGGFTHNLLN